MLISSEKLTNVPVMSLQTGGQLAQATSPLIDPRNLTIIGYELEGHALDQRPSFLMMSDVRELSSLGFIVDSSDEFIGLDDVIKVKEIYDFKFMLIGKKVIDEKKRKLGTVIGYSLEPSSFMIKQLNIKRPLLKSFNDAELIIDRTQILEINDDAIIIRHDEREPSPVKQAAKAYTNPFRNQSPQPEAIDRSKD